ncbi:GATA zinc finger-domain-containing protein, partial [Chytriomyces cf. hyalinus JEL632]
SCANCETSKTPLWRRNEAGQSICNACGLYFRLHGVNRVVAVKNTQYHRCQPNPTTTATSTTTKKSRRKKKETELYKCVNCSITETSLWRRDDDGNPICNPCGLYYRLHNKPRVVSANVPTVIRRRKRLTSIGSASGSVGVLEAVKQQLVAGDELLGGEEVHVVAGRAYVGGDGLGGVGGDGTVGVVGDVLDKDTDDDGFGSTHGENLRKGSLECSGEDVCALLVLANAAQASQE